MICIDGLQCIALDTLTRCCALDALTSCSAPEAVHKMFKLARTVYIHRIWPYIWWIPCKEYRLHTVYICIHVYIYGPGQPWLNVVHKSRALELVCAIHVVLMHMLWCVRHAVTRPCTLAVTQTLYISSYPGPIHQQLPRPYTSAVTQALYISSYPGPIHQQLPRPCTSAVTQTMYISS